MNVNDYKALYIGEAEEILQSLENGIIGLETCDDPDSLLEELFRHAHNLKGISGAMGYEAVVEASHALENVLDRFKRQELDFTQSEADLLLMAVDILRWLVQLAISGAGDGKERLSEFLAMLAPLCAPQEADGGKKAGQKRGSKSGATVQGPEKESAGPEQATAVAIDLMGEGPKLESFAFSSGITSTRVELELLDKLMDQVGELIISKIRLSRLAHELGSKKLADELVSTERLISDIQKEVMEIRLVPVGQVFQRFRRLVRDVAREMDKKVEFEIVGEDIGLDRQVLEGMVDPLVHLIRNALDHGIESIEERIAAGKPETAKIVLTARRERNFVIIEVSDDGRGINLNKVKKLGAYEGLMDRDKQELSEEDLCTILTAPGFSTSKTVDRLSGRGMGMNIVKKMLESLGGVLHIESEPDKGTRIMLQLPINLSIIKALLFFVGKEVHALPVEYVKETIRIERESFITIRGHEVLQVKNATIPVIKPWEIFGMPPEEGSSRFTKVIIVDSAEARVALIVNRILGQQDVVIKGLPEMIRGTSGVSGATILGSGEIAFIWDPKALLQGRCLHDNVQETVLLEN
jgi:two-component system chemotaxis sensor kinase CheA